LVVLRFAGARFVVGLLVRGIGVILWFVRSLEHSGTLKSVDNRAHRFDIET